MRRYQLRIGEMRGQPASHLRRSDGERRHASHLFGCYPRPGHDAEGHIQRQFGVDLQWRTGGQTIQGGKHAAFD